MEKEKEILGGRRGGRVLRMETNEPSDWALLNCSHVGILAMGPVSVIFFKLVVWLEIR